jgi:hypothetical protein
VRHRRCQAALERPRKRFDEPPPRARTRESPSATHISCRGERRAKRLLYLAAWLFLALSFMGEGAPRLVLALATFGGFRPW